MTVESWFEGAEPSSAALSTRTKLAQTFVDQPSAPQSKPRTEATGQLVLDNPYTGTDRSAGHAVSLEDITPAPRSDWTMVVDLAASQYTQRGEIGAARQFQAMQQMASETRGSHVSFIVQALLPIDRRENGDTATINGYQLHRYMIHDGQISQLGTAPTQGMQNDLRDLLQLAGRAAPSERIGLIMQSHGSPTRGLIGDADHMSLPQMNSAIRAGLQGSDHDRLDLVDFDACSTASINTLDTLRSVAGTMVGSAELEHAFGDADAQNLQAISRALIANPQMSGDELGRRLVGLAASGANTNRADGDHNGESATPDLNSFNVEQVSQLERSIDRFGAVLGAAAADPQVRRTLADIASRTPTYDAGAGHIAGNEPADRDLTAFVQGVQQAITSGAISDRDGSLAAAAGDLLASQRQVTTAHFGEERGGYDRLGGLSVFLPTPPTDADIDRGGQPIGSMQMSMDSPKGNTFNDREDLAGFLQLNVDQLVRSRQNGGQSDPLVDQLQAQTRELASAADFNAFNTTMSNIQQTLRQLDNGPLGAQERERAAAELQERRAQQLRDHSVPNAPQWNAFTALLSN